MPLTLSDEPITMDDRPYVPYGDARELFRCNATCLVIEGPAGTGKTRALLEKAHGFAEQWDGCRILLLRQTRESMTETVLVTFEEKVVPVGHPILDGASRKMRQAYSYPNGSEIVIGGLDKPSKLMSGEYDFIFVFESTEISESAFEMLMTRLRNGVIPYQQIALDCNPDSRTHWINQRANNGGLKRLQSRHEDNPELHNGKDWTAKGRKYIAKLDSLTGHRKERLRYGRWANAEGVVFPEFDSHVHIIDPFEIPRDWRRARTIDFGYKNPFVCQWWAIDPDDAVILYREIYMTQRIVADHAKQIKELSEGEKYDYTVADHDAEDRATLHREGIETIAARKDVSPGLNCVSARLRVRPNGRAGLYIFRNALFERDQSLQDAKRPCCTAEEYDAYIWRKTPDGKPIKDEPHKEFDHGMDAQRYFIMQEDGGESFDFRVVDTAPAKPKPKVPANDTPAMRFQRDMNNPRMWNEVEV